MADLNKILRDAAGNRLNPRTIISQVDNLPEKLAAIEAIVAPEFVTTNVYHVDDLVTHEDKLYKFTAEHAAGEWNPAHVSETTIVNELLEAGGLDLLADEYATANTYNKGDYAIYDRELYQCNTDGTTGEWDSTKWDKVTVADELGDLNSDMDDLIGEDKVYGPSGIVTFDSEVEGIPLKKVTSTIVPIQNLHGYDNPWPVGGGSNLCPLTANTQTINGITFTVNKDADGNAFSVTMNGTATASASFVIGSVDLPLETYILNAFVELPSGCTINAGAHGTRQSTEFTDEVSGNIILYVSSGATVSNVTVKPALYLKSVGMPTFQPYSNICPISGWTGAEIEQRGGNLLKPTEYGGVFYAARVGRSLAEVMAITATPIDDGYSVIIPSPWYGKIFATDVLPAGNYNAHVKTDVGNTRFAMYITDANYVVTSEVGRISQSGTVDEQITLTEKGRIVFFIGADSAITINVHDLQVESGSSFSSYHPYTGNQISVNWEDEAGTVYGGNINLTTGVLTADTVKAVADGTQTAMDSDTHRISFYDKFPTAAEYLPTDIQLKCNRLKPSAYTSASDVIYFSNEKIVNLRFSEEVSDWNSFLASNPVEFTYKVANPVTVQLDPITISTLYGQNNIWSNTGDTTVTLSSYIGSLLNDIEASKNSLNNRIDNLLSSDLATVESTTTASKNYSIGDYLVLDDQLYKVTSAIASGATIVPGTNVSATTLETEIKTGSTTAVTNVAYDTDNLKLVKTINGTESDILSIDATPTEDSVNPITSNALYDEVDKLYGDGEVYGPSSIVTFESAAEDLPISKVVTEFGPMQDLHGYDSPWPGGAGKNLFNLTGNTGSHGGVSVSFSNEIATFSGTSAQSGGRLNLITDSMSMRAGNYTIKTVWTGNPPAICLQHGATVIAQFGTQAAGNGYSFTLDSDYSDFNIGFAVDGSSAYNSTVQIMIVPSTETDLTYSTYSNICPISGWTGAEISNAAVNIWDEDWVNGYYDTSGNFASSNNYVCSKNKIMVEPDTLYYLHFPVAMTIRAYDSNQQFIGTAPGTWRNETFKPAGYFSGVRYITFNSAASGALTTYNNDISINYPATDTQYHPYIGNQISVTFPSSAGDSGTVYGGTLTLNQDRTGTLVVDKAVDDLGGMYWDYSSAYGGFFATQSIKGIVSGQIWRCKCERYKNLRLNSDNLLANDCVIGINAENGVPVTGAQVFKALMVSDNRYNGDVDSFKSAVSGTKVVYELDSPQTYQLTAEQVSGIMTTLYGTNNIWTSLNGNTTVTLNSVVPSLVDKINNLDNSIKAITNEQIDSLF